MTISAPIPAAEAASRMATPSDTASEAPTEQAAAQARAAAAVRPGLRAQVAENPLLSFFGLVIVALLAAAVAGPNIRISDINDRIDETNDRIDRLEDTIDARFVEIDARFDKMDARFDALEAAVGEINLKLTALIAHLNATSEVDNAIAGRLAGPSAPGPSAPDAPIDRRGGNAGVEADFGERALR